MKYIVLNSQLSLYKPLATIRKMKIFKLTFLLLIIISCKQKNEKPKSDLKPEQIKSEIITQEKEIESAYELYKKGKVDSFDWNLVSNKTKEFRTVSEEHSDKKLIPNDFIEFSKRFISDPSFQKEHINFDKLIAVVGACEETYVLKENNWVFDNWDFVNNLGIDEKMKNTFYFSDQFFFCEYLIKEIGTIRMLGFEKKDGNWFLTLYDINDC